MKLALCTIVLFALVLTPLTAQAGKFGLTLGGSVLYRDSADETFSVDFDGLYSLTRDLTLDIGYASSGEGATESYGRLGLLYTAYRFGGLDVESADVGIMLGLGGTVKAIGVENSDLGAFFTVGLDADVPTMGDWVFAYEVASGIDWPPTPSGRIRVAKKLTF